MYNYNYEFNSSFKHLIDGKRKEIAYDFYNLSLRNFPKEHSTLQYNNYKLFGGYEHFMVEGPNKILSVLDMYFKNLDEYDIESYEDVTSIQGKRFKRYFEAVTNSIKKFYGEPHYVVNGFQNPIDKVNFDDNLFACDDSITAYWTINDRIGFVQFNWGYGDCEFQTGVFLGFTKAFLPLSLV